MIKLLVFVVVSLFLTNVAFSKNVKLICEDVKNKGVFHILIINDNQKKLEIEQIPGVFRIANTSVYNNEQIVGSIKIKEKKIVTQKVNYNIDRRTGVLSLMNYFIEDGRMFTTISICVLFTKNKF